MRHLVSRALGLACAAGSTLSHATAPPDYILAVRSVLREKCVVCHGPSRQPMALE